MKRMLCIRFPNWPIQRLRRRLLTDGIEQTAVALHTLAPGHADDSKLLNDDLRFIRALYPSAISGPAIVAVSMDAWKLGVRPGMPLAEARSMAIPLSTGKTSLGNASRKPRDRKGAMSAENKSSNGSHPTEARRSAAKPRLAPPSIESLVSFQEWNPVEDRSEMAAVAELTRRYAPIVGLDDMPVPDSLLLDVSGCAPLFGGESGLAEFLLKDLRTAGWSCRIAIASNIATAWALTHTERPARTASSNQRFNRRDDRRSSDSDQHSADHDLPIQIIPTGQEMNELKPLPVASSRLSLKDLEILLHLGIRSIGQLLSLPVEDLPSRLSPSAVVRIQQLHDVSEEFITPLPEANPVAALWSGEQPATTLADHQYVFKYLCEQITEQLERRRVACTSVACEFRCLDGSLVPLIGNVVKPTQSAELLHDVLCLRIESAINEANFAAAQKPRTGNLDVEVTWESGELASLAFIPVRAVAITATTVPIPSARQRDLFSPTEHIVPEEELARLIGRLSNRLGADSVVTVETRPDPRPEHALQHHPVLSVDGTSNGHVRQTQLDATLRRLTEPGTHVQISDEPVHVPIRPLRLLETPLPLPVPLPTLQASVAPRRSGFPTTAIVNGQHESLIRFHGPERFQTGWWTDFPCHRDYFRVETQLDSLLWIFREIQTNRWFLHGIFD